MTGRVIGSLVLFLVAGSLLWAHGPETVPAGVALPSLQVHRTDDFAVDRKGSAPACAKEEWQALRARAAEGSPYQCRFKMLYSPTGLYVLMDGEDRTLTATLQEDFLALWNEDVFELPILVPNFGGQFLGWRPWHYDGTRKIEKAVAIAGGPPTSGAPSTTSRGSGRWCSSRSAPTAP